VDGHDVEQCECCGRDLKPGTEVHLEKDAETCLFHYPRDVPDAWRVAGPNGHVRSQGTFPFGRACSKKSVSPAPREA